MRGRINTYKKYLDRESGEVIIVIPSSKLCEITGDKLYHVVLEGESDDDYGKLTADQVLKEFNIKIN